MADKCDAPSRAYLRRAKPKRCAPKAWGAYHLAVAEATLEGAASIPIFLNNARKYSMAGIWKLLDTFNKLSSLAGKLAPP